MAPTGQRPLLKDSWHQKWRLWEEQFVDPPIAYINSVPWSFLLFYNNIICGVKTEVPHSYEIFFRHVLFLFVCFLLSVSLLSSLPPLSRNVCSTYSPEFEYFLENYLHFIYFLPPSVHVHCFMSYLCLSFCLFVNQHFIFHTFAPLAISESNFLIWKLFWWSKAVSKIFFSFIFIWDYGETR